MTESQEAIANLFKDEHTMFAEMIKLVELQAPKRYALASKSDHLHYLLKEDISDYLDLFLKATVTIALNYLFHIPKHTYVAEDAIIGDGPFEDIYIHNFCYSLGLTRSTDELVNLYENVQKEGVTELRVFAVLGRDVEDLDDLVRLVNDYGLEVVTQEDFVNMLLSGEIPGYSSNDPRILEHPGLLAFSNAWGESFVHEGRWPWPSTEAEPAENPYLDDVGWREQSDLKARYGYSVSQQSGLTKRKRRTILDRAVADLGLEKVAEHIAWLVRNAKARHDNRMSNAINSWESDLAYLRQTHYRQEFTWPFTDIRG